MDLFSNCDFSGVGILWVGAHIVGLLTAWMVRMHAGKRFEIVVQGGFFTSLLVVALATVAGHVWCLEMWPWSAVTLALMIVVAILDLGAEARGSVGFHS